MGYTTDFTGQIEVSPPLNDEEIEYLKKFSETRRMSCEQGPYYVDRGGLFGQDHEDGISNYNSPPAGQPSLWCQWVPTDDGQHIEWNGTEKFYCSVEWMQYLMDHFIGPTPLAAPELDFLQPHTLNGEITAQGEEYDDRWVLKVENNVASRVDQPRIGQKVCCPHCEEEFTLESSDS